MDLSKATLRAYVLFCTNADGDFPATELSYRRESLGKPGDEIICFTIVHTAPDGTEDVVGVQHIVKGAHSDSDIDRAFIDHVTSVVASMWAESKALFEAARGRFEKLSEAMSQVEGA